MSAIRMVVAERFGGKLEPGFHDPDSGQACAHEARSVALGIRWTDDPDAVKFPDIRPLNDGPWGSAEQRTESMLALLEALWDWHEWPAERRQRWAERVALRTVSEIAPVRLGRRPQWAALAATGRWPKYAAWEAGVTAATLIDEQGDAAAASEVLALACRIWIESAQETA